MTALSKERLFDDMGGKFVSRLRTHRISTVSSKSRGVEVTVQSSVAMLDAQFDIEVLDRLHDPCFVAIERPAKGRDLHLIYEVVGVRATHLQELGVDTAMPKVLREEFLRTIERGWKEGKENWIDVASVPTGYLVDVSGERIKFDRTKLTPLTGTRVRLLSLEAAKEFVCIEDGSEIGTLVGYGIPFTIRIPDLVRYHTGIFGFTGVGKSNLVSSLIRRSLEAIKDLRVVVFDVAGEYVVNLIDEMAEGSVITNEYEMLTDARAFVESQIVPETLEATLGGAGAVEKALERIHREGALRRLDLSSPRLTDPGLRMITSFLTRVAESGKAGSTAASVALIEIRKVFSRHRIGEDVLMRELSRNAAVKSQLVKVLQEFRSSVHQMSSEAKEAENLANFLQSPPSIGEEEEAKKEPPSLTPEDLAEEIVTKAMPRLVVVYVSDQIEARRAVARYIWRLLELKKKKHSRVNVLTVLDEAQEFIPDRTRKEDNTEESSVAVEALLRQGRKYRAGCWLSTQRVAHLNVNALQQLHSYFASTLPRLYDRIVVADAYSLDYEVLDRLAGLETGEWLFVSYKASKMRNVPVFLRAMNNEDNLMGFLASRRGF